MIEVGEYVRTKNQGIFIVSHINPDIVVNDFSRVCLCQNEKVAFGSIEEIEKLKHRKDIKDLLEVGDYVNGKLIHSICGNPKNGELMIIYGNGKHFDNKHIKSIVTHEQFESIEYKVEENK